MKLNKETKILIVGLGLIGGSYAKALSDKGYFVSAIDIDENAVSYALENGFIKSGECEVKGDFIKNFDLIIFALYPHTILNWIKENQRFIKENAILTDVTGIKTCFLYDVQDILRDDLEFIASHPMAGRESSGVENAKKEIFYGSNFIITPTEKNSKEAIALLEDLAKVMDFGKISTLSPEKHDETIGFLSQLTHCIAISLMTCRDMENMADYSGDSFRDLTRIAKINDEMWSELFLKNKEQLLSQMDLFQSAFNRLKQNIIENNRDEIRKIMKKSTNQRILFDKTKE